jgi:predicted anti-sigma-YlaC factor YlaD
MNPQSTAHLTKEELTDNLLGVPSLTVNAHLLSCPACAHELEQMKGSIASFRGAAHAWTEDALSAAESKTAGAYTLRTASWPSRWILVAAAMILFGVGSITYLRQQQIASQAHPAQVATSMASAGLSQAQLDQDNQLLSQVSGELSEAVPAPMQPLLVSESSGSTAVTNK